MIISVQNHRSNEFELSMEEKKEILKAIIEHQLLAPSPGELAKLMDLKTKSTLYRILKGTAKNLAISTLCQELDEKLDIDEGAILQMGLVIHDYQYLTTLLKHEPVRKEPETVVLSFVSGDYSCFSKQFIENHINEILQYAHEVPEGFFCALFYYYIRKSFDDFYIKNLPYLKQCERVLLPLADKLPQLYPANQFGKDYIKLMLDGKLYTNTNPTLWKCICGGGRMLTNYAMPNVYRQLMSNYVFLPDTDERTYWLTDNPEQIIMTFAPPINKNNLRSGFYLAFSVDLLDDKLNFLGSVGLSADGDVEICVGDNVDYKIGQYKYTNRNLIISLNDGSNTLGVGNRWRLINIDTIPEIKSLNDKIDDDEILRAIVNGSGFELLPDYGVIDVVVSRNEVSIYLRSGKKLVIPRNAYEFLSSIGPTDRVAVMRKTKDNSKFVAWSDLNYMIPLDEFKVENLHRE